MNILDKLISLFLKKKDVADTVCCSGCKHLFYWNDGSVGCDIEQEEACIPHSFCLREPKKSCLNCKNYSMRFSWCSKLDKYIELYSDAERCKLFDTY